MAENTETSVELDDLILDNFRLSEYNKQRFQKARSDKNRRKYLMDEYAENPNTYRGYLH